MDRIETDPSHLAALDRLLRQEIAAEGAITFARYMELALYHPEHGYYATAAGRTGRGGDFYTSVSVGPVFGRLLAGWLADVFKAMDGPDNFTVVEQGAAQGHLTADLLEGLQRDHAAIFARADFVIIEPLASLEKTQRQTLAAHIDKVRWIADLADLKPIAGCFLSNELVDAFPVHRVRLTKEGWLELRVTRDFGCMETPATSLDLSPLPPDLPVGYTTELRPSAVKWMREVAAKLHQGAVLAIDYGFPRSELYAPSRTSGTLRAFRQHRRLEEPLEAAPGSCDITAHVDFTGLAEAAAAGGLELAGFCDQHHLLVQLLQQLLAQTRNEACLTPKERRGFATLMHPETMGTQFKAIGFTRGIGQLETFRSLRSLGL